MNEKVLKNHFMFRKKKLAIRDTLTHYDIFLETLLRILVVPLSVEIFGVISNMFLGREVEFRPVRFWGTVVGLLVVSPIQLYILNWKLKKEINIKAEDLF